jgi:hypothetical protein
VSAKKALWMAKAVPETASVVAEEEAVVAVVAVAASPEVAALTETPMSTKLRRATMLTAKTGVLADLVVVVVEAMALTLWEVFQVMSPSMTAHPDNTRVATSNVNDAMMTDQELSMASSKMEAHVVAEVVRAVNVAAAAIMTDPELPMARNKMEAHVVAEVANAVAAAIIRAVDTAMTAWEVVSVAAVVAPVMDLAVDLVVATGMVAIVAVNAVVTRVVLQLSEHCTFPQEARHLLNQSSDYILSVDE